LVGLLGSTSICGGGVLGSLVGSLGLTSILEGECGEIPHCLPQVLEFDIYNYWTTLLDAN